MEEKEGGEIQEERKEGHISESHSEWFEYGAVFALLIVLVITWKITKKMDEWMKKIDM